MTTYEYKNHLIIFEIIKHSGAVAVSAIPDDGETIRETFYGYSPAQIKACIRQLINNKAA